MIIVPVGLKKTRWITMLPCKDQNIVADYQAYMYYLKGQP